jgi:hypothetical protein
MFSKTIDEKKGSPRMDGEVGVLEEKENNIEGTVEGQAVNASGHVDELQRQYSVWALTGLALSIDNAWVAFGASLAISVCKFHPLFSIQVRMLRANGISNHYEIF